MRRCEIGDCERDHYALGLCHRHYAAKRRDATTENHVRPARQCTVEGCGREYRANGYCCYHLTRQERFGNPTEPRRKGDPWTARENELLLAVPTCGRSGRAKPGSVAQLALELGRSKHAAHVQRCRLLRLAAEAAHSAPAG